MTERDDAGMQAYGSVDVHGGDMGGYDVYDGRESGGYSGPGSKRVHPHGVPKPRPGGYCNGCICRPPESCPYCEATS